MNHRHPKIAGTLLLLGGAQFWIINTICESIYPYYSPQSEPLSTLGEVGSHTQALWVTMIFVTAVTWLLGAALLFQGKGQTGWLILNLLPGAGFLALGFFPAASQPLWVHLAAAYWIFISAGVTAVSDFMILRPPFRYFSAVFGLIVLGVLLGQTALIPLLGIGGAERQVVYPIILWMIGFGAYHLGEQKELIHG